ncbi:hypothetical protein YPPY02_1030, partial [Yersinia pestis PY-02]
MAEAVRQL